jgi:short-subunit dehydrogenase
VTGGSAGLGLALAILLTKRGADVSIVARNEERLQKALDEMEVRVHFLSLLWVMIYIYMILIIEM